jgi:hypothetical protein
MRRRSTDAQLEWRLRKAPEQNAGADHVAFELRGRRNMLRGGRLQKAGQVLFDPGRAW